MLVTYNSNVSFWRPTVLPDYIQDQNIAKRAKVDASGGWYNLKGTFGISDVFERAVYYNNLSKEIIIHKLNTLYCCILTLHQLYSLVI